MNDVFSYKIASKDNLIYLKQNGEIKDTIEYRIDDLSGDMIWTGWEEGNTTLVGGDGPIERVVFTHKSGR